MPTAYTGGKLIDRSREKEVNTVNVEGSPEQSLNARAEHFMRLFGYCSQASFATLQDQLSIECDPASFIKALRPFPGTGFTQETCGAVSGCLLALGLIHGTADNSDQEQSARCIALARDFCTKVGAELGSTRCGDIMERQFGRRFDLYDPDQVREFSDAGAGEKCTEVVKTAVRIAYDLLRESPRPT